MSAALFTTTLALLLSSPAWAAFSGLSTYTTIVGSPTTACGVLPDKLKDSVNKPLPLVTLNTAGPYSSGKNCGRWIEITIGDNCVSGSNTDSAVCVGGGTPSFLSIMTANSFIARAHCWCCDEQLWPVAVAFT
jgi:hypothetical protein